MVETWQRPGENWSSMLIVFRDSEQGISLLQSSRDVTLFDSTDHCKSKNKIKME
jgi:hypothetical protein